MLVRLLVNLCIQKHLKSIVFNPAYLLRLAHNLASFSLIMCSKVYSDNPETGDNVAQSSTFYIWWRSAYSTHTIPTYYSSKQYSKLSLRIYRCNPLCAVQRVIQSRHFHHPDSYIMHFFLVHPTIPPLCISELKMS